MIEISKELADRIASALVVALAVVPPSSPMYAQIEAAEAALAEAIDQNAD